MIYQRQTNGSMFGHLFLSVNFSYNLTIYNGNIITHMYKKQNCTLCNLSKKNKVQTILIEMVNLSLKLPPYHSMLFYYI